MEKTNKLEANYRNDNKVLLNGTVAWNILISKYAPIQGVYKGSIFVFSSLVGKFGSNPKYWSLKLGYGFPCCSNYLYHWFLCCSKYDSMSLLVALNTLAQVFFVALNTIIMGFLVALITNSMNLFVPLEHDFQRELHDLWTFHKPLSVHEYTQQM